MKLLRHLIAIAFIAAPTIAGAGEQTGAKAECAANQMAADLQLLQGTWEGVDVGDPAQQKITITIAGHSLRFYRDKMFWFDTTFTLPAGKDPKQLHATIEESANGDSKGELVGAIFKIEDGTFTLASYGSNHDDPPKAFASYPSRYVLKKQVPPGK